MNSARINLNFGRFVEKVLNNRATLFGLMIFGALIAFEIFNFTTTQFALQDVLGDLTFAGVRWATILAFAFCSIDFAGIARIFTPEQGKDEPAEVWYLFGAWLLAAAMNATLTWWGVAVAIAEKGVAGTMVVSATTLNTAVPIFVALMVWVIRVLIIGTFSSMGDRLFNATQVRRTKPVQVAHPVVRQEQRQRAPMPSVQHVVAATPKNYQASAPRQNNYPRPNNYQAQNNYQKQNNAPQNQPVYRASAPQQQQRPPQQEAVLGGTRPSASEPTYHNVT